MARWAILLAFTLSMIAPVALAQTLPGMEFIGPPTVAEGVIERGQTFASVPVQTTGVATLAEPIFAHAVTFRPRTEVAPAGTRVYRVGIQSVENNRRRNDNAWCGETPYTIRFLFGSHFFCVIDNADSGAPAIFQVDGIPVPAGFARRAFAEAPPVVTIHASERVANQRIEYRHGGYAGPTLVIDIWHVDDTHGSFIDQIRTRAGEGESVVVTTRFGRFRFDRVEGREERANVTLVEQEANPPPKR